MTRQFRNDNHTAPLSPRAERDRAWLEQGVRWLMGEALRMQPTHPHRSWADKDPRSADLERILAAVLAPPAQAPPGFRACVLLEPASIAPSLTGTSEARGRP